MQKELSGDSCYPLEAGPTRRKSVMVSRSFKTPATTLEELYYMYTKVISQEKTLTCYQ